MDPLIKMAIIIRVNEQLRNYRKMKWEAEADFEYPIISLYFWYPCIYVKMCINLRVFSITL